MSKETPEGFAVDLADLAVDDEALVTDESAADEAVVTEPEPEDGPPTLTGTVEDGAIDALAALGSPVEPSGPLGYGPEALASSFRARRAGRLWRATDALVHGRPGAIALALDGSAFRVGEAWTDLSTRPLIRALANGLAESQADAAALDREALGPILWPDERLSAETRDQRLHTAVSTLRRSGLEIEAHEGGYRFDPAVPVVWVDPASWPGPAGALQRARGRGRPKRSGA